MFESFSRQGPEVVTVGGLEVAIVDTAVADVETQPVQIYESLAGI